MHPIEIRPSKKKKHVTLPDFYKKKRAGGRFFFVIYYFLLHAFCTHYYLPPGALRSNISKTKHQILIKHQFVLFWYTQRVNSRKLHYFGVYTAAMGFTSDACWFLLLKSLLIKIIIKKRGGAKKWSGRGRETCFFLNLA